MNLKKYIKPAAMFTGSLVVINVGIYFLLQATTPKIGPRAGETELAADSLHADSLLAEHTVVDSLPSESAAEEMSVADATAPVETESAPVVQKDVVAVSPPTIPEEPPAAKMEEYAASEAENPADAPLYDAENAVLAVKEGDLKEIAKLAKYLEAMKPTDAAAIAAQLDTDEIILLMMRMKDRTAGKILAELPVEQAARIASRMSQTASRTRSGS